MCCNVISHSLSPWCSADFADTDIATDRLRCTVLEFDLFQHLRRQEESGSLYKWYSAFWQSRAITRVCAKGWIDRSKKGWLMFLLIVRLPARKDPANYSDVARRGIDSHPPQASAAVSVSVICRRLSDSEVTRHSARIPRHEKDTAIGECEVACCLPCTALVCSHC